MKRYSKAVIDTTYLLPFFGIRIHNIEYETIIRIQRELNAKLIYPMLVIPELITKIGREMQKTGRKRIPAEVKDALSALLLEIDVELVQPKVKHLETAIKLRALGHKDIFDNILYATSLHEEAYFITRDESFIEFLKNNRLPVDHIIKY